MYVIQTRCLNSNVDTYLKNELMYIFQGMNIMRAYYSPCRYMFWGLRRFGEVSLALTFWHQDFLALRRFDAGVLARDSLAQISFGA